MKECVEANYASNTQNPRRKIKRKISGWAYAHLDENEKTWRTSYTLKPGEMTYTQYCELFSFVFLVNKILKIIS